MSSTSSRETCGNTLVGSCLSCSCRYRRHFQSLCMVDADNLTRDLSGIVVRKKNFSKARDQLNAVYKYPKNKMSMDFVHRDRKSVV